MMMICSFCHQGIGEVPHLIIGPKVNICSDCVMLCLETIIKDCDKHRKQNEELRNALYLAEIG